MNTATHNKSSEDSSLIRLQRVLAMAGVDSRRHCEEYILTGRVTVDGHTITALGSRVDPHVQDVRLDGERLKLERPVYYLLHKPRGCVCTNSDPAGRLRAVDLVPGDRQRLFTVGRLDENSTGLLLCTNDGELAHRLAHPKFRVTKLYSVQVAGIPTREAVQQLKEGMYFADGRFKADDVRLVRTHGQSAFLEMELTEGQNREIRRLLARIGHKVLMLQRIAMGPLKLGDVPEGSYRMLNPGEIRQLQEFSLGGGTKSPRKGTKGTKSRQGSGPRQRGGSSSSARRDAARSAGTRSGGSRRAGSSAGRAAGGRSAGGHSAGGHSAGGRAAGAKKSGASAGRRKGKGR